MKKGLTLVILLCSYLASFAQNDTIFYNTEWEVIENRDTASYFRLFDRYNKKTKLYYFVDYYITGEVQSTCSYTDKKGTNRSGEFLWYYQNGQLKEKGTYIDDQGIGEFYQYFDNGDLKQHYTYDIEKGDNGPFKKYLEQYDEITREHIIVNGQGTYKSYYGNGILSLTGAVENGFAIGTWKAYLEDGVLCNQEEYVKGVFQNGISYDKEGNTHPYTQREIMPEYQGGLSALLHYIGSIKYPDEARQKNISGKVYVQFVIDKQGNVLDVITLRSSGSELLDNAAVAHIAQMKQWKPGIQKGLPVRVQYVVPISFKL